MAGKYAFDDPDAEQAFDTSSFDEESDQQAAQTKQAQDQFDESRNFRNYLRHVSADKETREKEGNTRYSPSTLY